jgi:hypothetical protein
MKQRPERRPTPPPLETNEVAIAVTGTIAWAVALVVLAVFFRSDLQRHDTTWWLWACGLGVVLGLYGLRFALRRRRG